MPSPLLHDTIFKMELATREAREATFAPPTKRSKSGWPHKTPTPADLSKAGFYYKPTPHSNDNTVCFLCDRNLDGWEAEDDPIQEHLKHAENCGWALLMNVEAANQYDPSTMEDPTTSQLVDARRATFAIGWPHESKRGWTCKTEKMVEAGWYFAPTSGSEDYVSCAYCKLSLDGWEPKDNPFEEHYSRSPSCPFFVFAGTTAPTKRPKAKAGRAPRGSRTSRVSTRLSTQSIATVQSETTSIPDLDESIDTSTVSMMSTVSTATTKGKRKAVTGKAKTTKTKRAKTTKSKKAETIEPESMTETTGTVMELENHEEPSTNVSYPRLQPSIEQPQQEIEQPVESTTNEMAVGHTPVGTPEIPAGPPEMPTHTIPVSNESPMPKSSQKQPKRTSGRRSLPKKADPVAITPTLSSPSQPSDVENAPPSARPVSARPLLPSPGTTAPRWEPVDVDMIFEATPGTVVETSNLSDAERQMTVQEWVKHIAEKAESELRAEGERVVGILEKEGQRALTVLEGIVCV